MRRFLEYDSMWSCTLGFGCVANTCLSGFLLQGGKRTAHIPPGIKGSAMDAVTKKSFEMWVGKITHGSPYHTRRSALSWHTYEVHVRKAGPHGRERGLTVTLCESLPGLWCSEFKQHFWCGFFPWNIFIIRNNQIMMTISIFWYLKIFRREPQKAFCALPTSYSGGCNRMTEIPRSSVYGRNFPWAGVSARVPGDGEKKYELPCIWPNTQCFIARRNSFLTPAGEQLCPGARDGHAL